MKRILSLILAVLMCFSLCLAFASCEFFGNSDDKDDDSGKKETVYTITQDEWDANLEEVNYTADMKMVMEMVYSMGEMEQSMKVSADALIEQTSDSCYQENITKSEYTGSDPQEDEEIGYYQKKGDKVYQISEGKDGWIGEEYDYSFDPISEVFDSFAEGITYDDLIYDEEKKVYTYVTNGSYMGMDEGEINMEIRFENGKIVKIEMVMDYEVAEDGVEVNCDFTCTINFSKLGKTTVEVPAYEIVE